MLFLSSPWDTFLYQESLKAAIGMCDVPSCPPECVSITPTQGWLRAQWCITCTAQSFLAKESLGGEESGEAKILAMLYSPRPMPYYKSGLFSSSLFLFIATLKLPSSPRSLYQYWFLGLHHHKWNLSSH